jgi:septal ring factor EnvC (AmiA/AmiB activator)
MAIGWWTVLQSVPWAEVVSNAPKVAAGAKKLWAAVGRKTHAGAQVADATQASLSPEARAITALTAHVSELETAVKELQEQMLASSELIKALAEQNTQLIFRIETQRRRMAWLAGALVLVGMAALASLVLLLAR